MKFMESANTNTWNTSAAQVNAASEGETPYLPNSCVFCAAWTSLCDIL
jgi:hypothetical protein